MLLYSWMVVVVSVTISIRVPKKLKERMDALRGYVNWSEEIRGFLERRVRELEQIIAVQELERVIKRLPLVPRGTAVSYVREDRDSR